MFLRSGKLLCSVFAVDTAVGVAPPKKNRKCADTEFYRAKAYKTWNRDVDEEAIQNIMRTLIDPHANFLGVSASHASTPLLAPERYG